MSGLQWYSVLCELLQLDDFVAHTWLSAWQAGQKMIGRFGNDPYVKLYIRVVMQSSRLCKVAFLRLVQGEAGSGKALADVAECST